MTFAASNTPLPVDNDLPGLPTLLDPERFARAAAALLPPGETIRACRLQYLRYKPGTNAVAVYELHLADRAAPLLVHGKCHAAADYEEAREKAASGRLIAPEFARPFATGDADFMLMFAFPNDQVLHGMRFAASPKRLQRALYAHEPQLDPEFWRISDRRLVITPVRFKPEKRAVLQVETRARHKLDGSKRALRFFVRVDDAHDGSAAALMTRLHEEFAARGDLATPRVIAWFAAEKTTLVADLGGQAPTFDTSGATAAGRALAVLHSAETSGLLAPAPGSALTAAGRAIEGVAELVPSAARARRGLVDRLANLAADQATDGEFGFVHGDFHPGQILILPTGPAVLDFDRSHLGPQAADLGNYQAHLVGAALLAGKSPDAITAQRRAFLAAYADGGGRVVAAPCLAFWTALGLLQLAPMPFRLLHPAWPRVTEEILAASRQELA